MTHFTTATRKFRSTIFNRTISRFLSSETRIYNRSRIGIGGSKLGQNPNLSHHSSVIATSLQNGITTFESGHDDNGEQYLSRGYQDAIKYLSETKSYDELQVTLSGRLGYRSMTTSDEYPKDVIVKDYAGETKNSDDSSRSDELKSKREASNNDTVIHNLSKEYVSFCLSSSPLVELKKIHPNVNLLYMAHNPEVQGSDLAATGASLDSVRSLVKKRLTDAFIGFEIGVAEKKITSYGVCSNGLSLPSSHPLHLSWEDVLSASCDAVQKVRGQDGAIANLSTLQMPANVLEYHGLKVATKVKKFLASQSNEKSLHLPDSINIHITRPLTCYPDRGTGTGYPFKMVDYQLPSSINDSNTSEQWTNQNIGQTPPYYVLALNKAMRHFDATHLLEVSKNGKLTTEESETLDGARLLQSMIHDLDSNLSSGLFRSFSAYEEELYTKIVPLIHDSFEELDEETSSVLQGFFKAYGNAVKKSIANTTRKLLKDGGVGVDSYIISDNLTLQESALQFLLKQQVSDSTIHLVDRVIVGCPQPEYVLQAVQAADNLE